jgi:hypothetical protein
VRRDLVVLLLQSEERPSGTSGRVRVCDVWTWTAICADTKLVPTWLVGERSGYDAEVFMRDTGPGPLSRARPYLGATRHLLQM